MAVKQYKHSKQKGLTLIELLISVTILSMLLLTATYSYNIIANRWDKALLGFESVQLESKNLNLLKRVLEGIQGAVVSNNSGVPSLFFIGNNDNLLAVTQSGLFSDSAEIFRLSTSENNQGKLELVYQAKSTSSILLTKTDQVIEFDYEIVLLTGIEKVDFSYFGWLDSTQKSGVDGKAPQWFSRMSGIDNKTMPSKLKLKITKDTLPLTFFASLNENASLLLSPYREDE